MVILIAIFAPPYKIGMWVWKMKIIDILVISSGIKL